MDFINRLREKTPTAKNQIAFVASAVVTLAIFGLWLTVFRFNIDSKPSETTASINNANGSASTDVNPLSGFWNVISNGWNGLSNNVNQAKSETGQTQVFSNSLNESASTTVFTGPAATTESASPAPTSQPAASEAPATQSTAVPATQNDVFILDNSTQ